ncbi:ATP synthase I chain [Mycolicibacterium chubuense NBB4]|uniref:ATP synthase I chain n=1 Tax=Mycolicibacterium chubuense (strain NBB4) TaxID=710421 RepID=I4BMJ7_MYCCN|nr:ATP synthase subunit I [Mycolicibacterium chubuense]AFM18504.1 ATP synthase I chain [Mycolicibacterium chubuense NBB4]
MTTPAQDAPLVFPSVAFRPVRLLVLCVALTAVVTAVAALVGYPLFGLFFGVGMALGLLNALLVRRAVNAITAQDHPLKKKMALNSASRLLAITVVGLTIAFLFRPMGLGVLFGLALFQVVLVLSTSLPVLKKLRAGDGDQGPAATTDSSTSNDG